MVLTLDVNYFVLAERIEIFLERKFLTEPYTSGECCHLVLINGIIFFLAESIDYILMSFTLRERPKQNSTILASADICERNGADVFLFLISETDYVHLYL